MSRLGSIGRAIASGLRTGGDAAIAAFLQQSVLAGTPPGFDRAFGVARQVPGWFDELSAATFWAVIHEIRPRRLVEIGSYLGRSTILTAEALRAVDVDTAELHAIDPHTGDRQHLEMLGLQSVPTLDLFRVFLEASGNADAVRLHVARSSDVLVGWSDPVDFVFVDGWHQYDAVLADVRGFGAFLSPHGVMCVDDVENYDEVGRASRTALAELGLTHYGVLAGKAWAGRPASPPECLRQPLDLSRRIRPRRGAPRGR